MGHGCAFSATLAFQRIGNLLITAKQLAMHLKGHLKGHRIPLQAAFEILISKEALICVGPIN